MYVLYTCGDKYNICIHTLASCMSNCINMCDRIYTCACVCVRIYREICKEAERESCEHTTGCPSTHVYVQIHWCISKCLRVNASTCVRMRNVSEHVYVYGIPLNTHTCHSYTYRLTERERERERRRVVSARVDVLLTLSLSASISFCLCIYVYVYTEREREREWCKDGNT